MAEKTIVQKLFLKPGQTFLLLNAPPGYRASLGELPERLTVLTEARGPADVIQWFVTSRKELEAELPCLKALLRPAGILWVAYPKGTSRLKTDLNRDIIRKYAPTIGLEAVAIFSIDDTWSSLRLKIA